MTQHIWGEGVKVFISHASSTRPLAGEVKDSLAKRGVSAFVAHEDIQTTAQWQEVILEALSSMDMFLAILSQDFCESAYCDQELGFAISERRRRADAHPERPLTIMAVTCDNTDPYGFLRGEQAAKVRQAADIPSKVLDVLFGKDFDLWFKSFIRRIRYSPDYDNSNKNLATELKKVEKLTVEQANELVDAVNTSSQAYMVWRFVRAMERKIVQCPGTGQISFYSEHTSPHPLPEIQFRIDRDDG